MTKRIKSGMADLDAMRVFPAGTVYRHKLTKKDVKKISKDLYEVSVRFTIIPENNHARLLEDER